MTPDKPTFVRPRSNFSFGEGAKLKDIDTIDPERGIKGSPGPEHGYDKYRTYGYKSKSDAEEDLKRGLDDRRLDESQGRLIQVWDDGKVTWGFDIDESGGSGGDMGDGNGGSGSGSCAVCGRDLTDPESIARGVGPFCAQKGANVEEEDDPIPVQDVDESVLDDEPDDFGQDAKGIRYTDEYRNFPSLPGVEEAEKEELDAFYAMSRAQVEVDRAKKAAAADPGNTAARDRLEAALENEERARQRSRETKARADELIKQSRDRRDRHFGLK